MKIARLTPLLVLLIGPLSGCGIMITNVNEEEPGVFKLITHGSHMNSREDMFARINKKAQRTCAPLSYKLEGVQPIEYKTSEFYYNGRYEKSYTKTLTRTAICINENESENAKTIEPTTEDSISGKSASEKPENLQ